MPVCRPLGDGLFEVRSTLESNRIARIFLHDEGEPRPVARLREEDAEDPDSRLGALSQTEKGHRRMTKAKAGKGKIGSRFDDFLRQEGLYAETQAVAIKRVLAWQLTEAMKKQRLTKSAMAKRMATSRSQLDRLLDPENADVQLDTLARAASAVNCELQLQLSARVVARK
jgi:DNA-binding Xre family transcriptional regulator